MLPPAAAPRSLVGADPATGRRPVLIAVAGAGAVAFVAYAITVGWLGYHDPWPAFVLAETVGLSFLAAGLVAWWLRPLNRMGPLMVAAGALWYLTNLQDAGSAVLFALGYWLTYLPPVLFGHLALAYPTGRLTRPADRWVVGTMYASYLVLQGIRYLREGDDGPIGWHPSPITPLANLLSLTGLLFNIAICVLIVWRWRAASKPVRRVHAGVWFGIIFTDAVITTAVVASVIDLGRTVRIFLLLCYGLGLITVPFLFLSGLLRVRLAHLRVADLVVRLERATEPAQLQDLLARTLGDPTLVLGFWADGRQGYVDAAGRPVGLPGSGGPRHATPVGEGEHRLAVLVHDAALADQRSLVRAAVAAARLALENARLQALLRAQLVELRDSRHRIARAALDERLKIERDLHDGAQQRLLRLAWLAKRARALAGEADDPAGMVALLDELTEEARETHGELRDLAQGIHPSVVTASGLAAAVAEYADRAPLALAVDLPTGRFPPAVEVTAYFVIAEAVVNAAKHAGADRVEVRGWHRAGRLGVEVSDRGAGGADPARGSGLRGLRDRVNALGGELTVHSTPGEGTTVRVELPCD